MKRHETPALLAKFATEVFPSGGGAAPPSCPPLRELYEGFNGGYYWSHALLVRPASPLPDRQPMSVTEWNAEPLWRHLYDGRCDGIVFFAEDAFGVQFGVQGTAVVSFDPETAAIEVVANSLDEWASRIVADAAYFTGAPLIREWEREFGPLAPGFRLHPKRLFMLGGEYSLDNLAGKPDVEGMIVRAGLWQATRDLPDGTRFSFRVVE